MFKVGDIVLYTPTGICTIVDQPERIFNGKLTSYYLLVPINDKKIEINIQKDNELTIQRLHNLIDKDDVEILLDKIPQLDTVWIDNDNLRKLELSRIVKSGDRLETLRVIKSIKKHQIELREKNRKLHVADEQIFKDAIKIVADEFAYLKGIDKLDMSKTILQLIEI